MELTNIEKDHYLFMTNIVKSLADTPYILKGGTALMFGYKLDSIIPQELQHEIYMI